MCILGQPPSCRWRYYAESVTDDSPSAPTAQRLLCTVLGGCDVQGFVLRGEVGWFVAQLDQIFHRPDNNKILYSKELGVGRLGIKDKEEVLIFQY